MKSYRNLNVKKMYRYSVACWLVFRPGIHHCHWKSLCSGRPRQEQGSLFGLRTWKKSTGCPKKNETGFLIDISATNDRIFKSFSSPENWDPYTHFEYRTIFVRLKGAEKFAKQNVVLKQINSYLYCLILALKLQNLCQALQTGPRQALIAPKWGPVGLVTQTNWIDVKTVFILVVFKIYRTSKSKNWVLTTIT